MFFYVVSGFVSVSPCTLQPGERKGAAPATRCYRGSRLFHRAATLESVSPLSRAATWWENLITTTTDPCARLLGHFKPHVHLNDCTSRWAVFKRYAPTRPPFICRPDNRNQSTVLISSHLHPERLVSPVAQRIKEDTCLLSAHLVTSPVLFS